MQDLWVAVECRVDETDSLLAGSEAFFVDAVQDSCEKRRCCRCAANEFGYAVDEEYEVVTKKPISK